MTTETKDNMEMVRDNIQEEIANTQKRILELQETLSIIPMIPTAIRELAEWMELSKNKDGQWVLTSRYQLSKEADRIATQLKILGVQNLRCLHQFAWDGWYYEGIFASGGLTFKIHIDGGSQPPTCRVEKSAIKMTTYKTICEQTGEEIK